MNIDREANPWQSHDCTILALDTVTPEPIRWLWPGRIPLGMFVLIAGQPGVGKTTISHSIAATLTNGGKWPFSDHHADTGDVIILTAEDDPVHTLAPRLIAAGANRKRVKLIQSVARLQDDPTKLGMNCTKWARELGVPRTTFRRSSAWERIKGCQIARANQR